MSSCWRVDASSLMCRASCIALLTPAFESISCCCRLDVCFLLEARSALALSKSWCDCERFRSRSQYSLLFTDVWLVASRYSLARTDNASLDCASRARSASLRAVSRESRSSQARARLSSAFAHRESASSSRCAISFSAVRALASSSCESRRGSVVLFCHSIPSLGKEAEVITPWLQEAAVWVTTVGGQAGKTKWYCSCPRGEEQAYAFPRKG